MTGYKKIWEKAVSNVVSQRKKQNRDLEMDPSSAVAQRILLELACGPDGKGLRDQLAAGELDQFREMLRENFLQDEAILLACTSTLTMNDCPDILPEVAQAVLREVKKNRKAPVDLPPRSSTFSAYDHA